MNLSIEEKLRKHFEFWGAKPIKKEVINGEEVFFADGGPHYDAPKTFPHGYFVSAFGIKRGKQMLVQPLWFEYTHDLNLTDRRTARVNAARNKAIEHIQIGKQAKLYG